MEVANYIYCDCDRKLYQKLHAYYVETKAYRRKNEALWKHSEKVYCEIKVSFLIKV